MQPYRGAGQSDLEGTNVLRDASSLTRSHRSLSQGVQQRGLQSKMRGSQQDMQTQMEVSVTGQESAGTQ